MLTNLSWDTDVVMSAEASEHCTDLERKKTWDSSCVHLLKRRSLFRKVWREASSWLVKAILPCRNNWICENHYRAHSIAAGTTSNTCWWPSACKIVKYMCTVGSVWWPCTIVHVHSGYSVVTLLRWSGFRPPRSINSCGKTEELEKRGEEKMSVPPWGVQ